jgi:hypothetical protein
VFAQWDFPLHYKNKRYVPPIKFVENQNNLGNTSVTHGMTLYRKGKCLGANSLLFTPANYCINDFILIQFYKIVIFILSARRECFLCMKRSFTPRRRSRQYKPLNAQKHLHARNINNIFSIIDSKN